MMEVTKLAGCELKKLLDRENPTEIGKMLSLDLKTGRALLLSTEETHNVKEKMIEATPQGFAADAQSFKYASGRIATDRREGWKNEISCDAPI